MIKTQISIIDDDKSVREAMKGLVRSLGYEADAFQSAEEFLQSGAVQWTSCVIADVHMPGCSGLDLHARLLADGRRTPIIFITAYPNERAKAQAVKAGAIGYLVKPFNDDALITCIDQALAREG